jgi:hypothetical protein
MVAWLLLHLANELLHEIGACFIAVPPMDRLRQQEDLSNLSKTCRHLRQIGAEALLAHPVVRVGQAASFAQFVLSYKDLTKKTHEIEIREHLVAYPDFLFHHSERVKNDEDLKEGCEAIIHGFAGPDYVKQQWMADIENGYDDAFLAVALTNLPHLRDLSFGAGNLELAKRNAKAAKAQSSRGRVSLEEEDEMCGPGRRGESALYLRTVYQAIWAKIENLDVRQMDHMPAGWSFPGAIISPSMANMPFLRRIVLPQESFATNRLDIVTGHPLFI